jgi:hypothetical protein
LGLLGKWRTYLWIKNEKFERMMKDVRNPKEAKKREADSVERGMMEEGERKIGRRER